MARRRWQSPGSAWDDPDEVKLLVVCFGYLLFALCVVSLFFW
jgi:hypothetical protein